MNPFQLSYVALNAGSLEDYTSILTSTRDFDPEKQVLLGCLCNGKPCAVAAARSLEGRYYELLWLEVVGGLRHRGIGTSLLKTFLKSLKAIGAEQITASASRSFPAAAELQTFLLKNGFSSPVVTQMVYFAGFEDVRAGISKEDAQLLPQMEDSMHPLSNLPPKTAKALKLAVKEKRIPDFILPENAVGSLLEEYSLAYTEAQSVCAAIMYSELPEILYLDSLYISRLHHKEGMHLVFYTLSRAIDEYDRAGTLALDAINPRSVALAEHFASRIPHVKETRMAMRKTL